MGYLCLSAFVDRNVEAFINQYLRSDIIKKLICILLILMSIVVGCANKNNVKVVPSTIFQGDTRLLGLHMDIISGCVEVKYNGDKKTIVVDYEIWEDGKLKDSENAISYQIKNGKFNGEVSISLKKNNDKSMEMNTVISEDKEYSGAGKQIEGFTDEYAHASRELEKTIKVTDNDKIIIWGLSANKEGKIRFGSDDIQSYIKSENWGLLLKLHFE